MKPIEVDVAVIGAGTAGMGAYRVARAWTDSVFLIEGGAYGTTCARVGCMPSKLLIAAAQAAQAAHQARCTEPFGVQVERVTVDGVAVMARLQRERDRFVGFVLDTIESIAPCKRLAAKVAFQDAHTLVTEQGQLIKAKRIVIATGSIPALPPVLKGLAARLLTNENLFDLPTLPRSLAVFGPGILGMELAQAMSRLGVSVKVLASTAVSPAFTTLPFVTAPMRFSMKSFIWTRRRR